MLHGHPLQILQAASLARDSGRAIDEISINIANDKVKDIGMTFIEMANLNSSEKQILMLLAATGGNTVAQEHIQNIFKTGNVQADIDRLIKLGIVQSHSPRFSISGTLAASISSTWDIASWQNTLLSYAINWLSRQPASALVEESSDFLIYTLNNAGERQKWREVIQLGCALEKFMIFNKRWQAWSDILNGIVAPVKVNSSGCRKYFTYGCGAVVAITFLAIVAWIIFILLRPSINNVPPTEPPTVVTFPSETPFPTPTFTITSTPYEYCYRDSASYSDAHRNTHT
jgi:hypothetical protein